MGHRAPDRIRNVALIGHRGSGKTSLAEAILFEAGKINRLGSVTEGTTVCDHEPDEQERQMSIDAAVASIDFHDRKINLIDTPGDPSFVADALAALRVVDSAVVVVNAVSGVEVHTERLWKRAATEGLSRLIFVNMLDRERADFFKTLESLKAAFGVHVVATEIPIGSEHEVKGVIDLIDMKAFVYEGEGRGNSSEAEIPEELQDLAQEYREKLMDEVAENSDELMERYLEGEEISHEEIVTALKKGVTEGHLFPVTCGIATKNLGSDRLLEALLEDLPSPAMRGAIHALGADDEDADIEPEEDASGPRVRLQDDRRPLHGPDQPPAGGVGRPSLGLAPDQRHARLEGADRPARLAVGQGHGPGGRARPRRHRRRPEAEGHTGRRRSGREADGHPLSAARPAGSGHGVRLRGEDQGRRGEGRRRRSTASKRRTRRSTSTATRRPASRSSRA